MLRRGLDGCAMPLHREIKWGIRGGIQRPAAIDTHVIIESLGR